MRQLSWGARRRLIASKKRRNASNIEDKFGIMDLPSAYECSRPDGRLHSAVYFFKILSRAVASMARLRRSLARYSCFRKGWFGYMRDLRLFNERRSHAIPGMLLPTDVVATHAIPRSHVDVLAKWDTASAAVHPILRSHIF
jgi:hypothetical protein